MVRAIDLTGVRKGKLVALARVDNDVIGKAQWVCQCDCGGAHIARSDNFRAGRITHCENCAREQPGQLRIDAWYHLQLLGSEYTGRPAIVDGVAGFCVVTRGEVELIQPEWCVGRLARTVPHPVINPAVRALARAGLIRGGVDAPAASAWARRNAARIVHHSFNDGDLVWAEWYGRTGQWRGPAEEIELSVLADV